MDQISTTKQLIRPFIYEYIWFDGDKLRSKVKVYHPETYDTPIIKGMTEWNFDGSSTGQASGSNSDVFLRPVFYCADPFTESNFEPFGMHSIFVLCDTYNADGSTHVTNYAKECKEICTLTANSEHWFGFEQEYIIIDKCTDRPTGSSDLMIAQGLDHFITTRDGFTSSPFYCSTEWNSEYGRKIVEDHMRMCIRANIKICGTNAEVTIGQWEYQIGPLEGLQASHQLWMSRFILNRIAEKYGAYILYHPKPYLNWNGSGCHTNFSTIEMRREGGLSHIIEACEKLSKVHQEHLLEYGDITLNKMRLTGAHETASHDTFRYGVSDRGASIRIPLNVSKDKKGYLEDRRPGSHCDPYRVVSRILKTVCM